MTIAICAVLAGADTWEEIAEFGEAKLSWLQGFLELPHGIPSPDTFARVFARLDPRAFEAAFLIWMQAVATQISGLIAVDGKRVRGVQGMGASPLHVVSAWAAEARLVLGQVRTEAKSDEITTIPELLSLLDLNGCIVSIDAQGCQKAIAGQIREQGGDYVLALKANHPNLLHEVEAVWEIRLENHFAYHPYSSYQNYDKAHGRQELRRYYLIDLPTWLAEDTAGWRDLRCLRLVQTERQVEDKVQRQNRCSLTSLPREAQSFAAVVRGHWQIENQVHWVLDVSIREDASRVHKNHAPANLSLVRRLALNLLRQDTAKGSLKGKRRKAGWNEAYLHNLFINQLQ